MAWACSWALLALGIDQDDFQRRIFETPVELLGRNKAHGEQHRVHGQGE